MQVLHVCSEMFPLLKTGGLADVVYALPRAIDKSKYEVKGVLPLLKTIKDKKERDRIKRIKKLIAIKDPVKKVVDDYEIGDIFA